MMHTYVHTQPLTYTGHQLASLWAYKSFGLQGDSIVCFRGPCRIEFDEMVDIEDVLAQSPIYGPDMLHFIIEHFGGGLEQGVLRQRLLMSIIKDQLGNQGITREGDDLYYNERKLSISIATISPVSVMIHAALNIVSTGTPVNAAGLYDLGFQEDEILKTGEKICDLYAGEMMSVRMACCKVKGVK